MPKKISRVLSKQRPFAGDPYALVNHVHPPDFPPVAANISERNLLAGDQRYEGVIIYVQSDLTTYQLRGGISNDDWTTLVTATGVASHFELGDIGTNTHVQIDAHIADVTGGGGEYPTTAEANAVGIDAEGTGDAQQIFFKADGSDGSRMWIVDSQSGIDQVKVYDLSIPWDLSTGVFNSTIGIIDLEALGGSTGVIQGAQWNSDGTLLFTCHSDPLDIVKQYTASTPWDIGTLSFDEEIVFNVSGVSPFTAPEGMSVNSANTKLILIDGSELISSYSMTANQVSTLALDGDTFDASTNLLNRRNFNISPDGLNLYALDADGADHIDKFVMTSSYDLTTMSYHSLLIQFDFPADGPFVRAATETIYVEDDDTDKYIQFGGSGSSLFHFTEASISITESQISDLQVYSLPNHNHDLLYLAIAGAAVSADALNSATSVIDVASAPEPLIGQVLTATNHDTATWQFPPGGGGGGSGDIVQTGTPAATFVAYFTADKNLTGDAGMTWITASARLNITGTDPVIRLQDNNNPGITMTTKMEFFDQTALIGEVGFLSGNSGDLSLKNTVGGIRFNTDGSADVVVTGDGNLAIGGYIDDYADSPVDGAFLTWVDSNSRAEFLLPTVLQSVGTPVDNQIAVFASINSIDGDPNFTWDQLTFAALDFIYTSVNDQLVLGGGDLAVPGIFIKGSDTASPFVNLQQDGVTVGQLRFSNSATRLELNSSIDEIAIRPGNVDTLILTSTLVSVNIGLATTDDIDVGTEILFNEMGDHVFTLVAGKGIVWLRDDANGNKLIFSDDENVDWVLNEQSATLSDSFLLMGG